MAQLAILGNSESNTSVVVGKKFQVIQRLSLSSFPRLLHANLAEDKGKYHKNRSLPSHVHKIPANHRI